MGFAGAAALPCRQHAASAEPKSHQCGCAAERLSCLACMCPSGSKVMSPGFAPPPLPPVSGRSTARPAPSLLAAST